MKKAQISIIAAIGENRELGKKNELIWRIPADLKRVRELTTGHPIIMGRKTFESIGKPLPNRTNIIISRTASDIEGCLVFDSLEKGIVAAQTADTEEIFIFGGASIYTEALPLVDRLYLTRVYATASEADTLFPNYSEFTNVVAKEDHLEHTPPYAWVTLEK